MGSRAPERVAMYAAIAVLILGPIVQVVTQGSQLLSRPTFYFGFFGWLSTALVVAYVVWLVVSARQPESG